MGMHKSVYIGPYIKAELPKDVEIEGWYPKYDEGGAKELCSGEVFIPNSDPVYKEVGGFHLADESGVFTLPPQTQQPCEALTKHLEQFKAFDENATLCYGVIVSWG